MRIGIGLPIANHRAQGASTPTTLETLDALLAGNSAIFNFPDATGSPLGCDDLSSLSNDALRVAGGNPTVSASLGLELTSGSNDNIAFAVAGETYTLIVSGVFESSDTSGRAFSTNTGSEILRMIQGNGTPNPFTTEVAGVAQSTRGDAWTAATTGSEVVIMITGIDMTGLARLTLGRSGGDAFGSTIRRGVIIDEGSVTGSDLTDARTNGKTWVAES